MGEALIIRSGGGYNSGSGSGEDKNIIGWQVKTEVYKSNGYFSVPKAKDQEFHVRIFGGGGGFGSSNISGGGGGGNMNNDTLILNRGQSIQITIGAGGVRNGNGGITAFGTYLSATGGERGSGEMWCGNGGNGGAGGGATMSQNSGGDNKIGRGGNATYGGGGGVNGGWWYGSYPNNVAKGGHGGTYGGNGGGCTFPTIMGTNTVSNTTLEFVGEGKYGGWGISDT